MLISGCVLHQQKKTCLHMYLLCLTGTCNNWQGFCKEIFCNVCKPGQGLTVDLQPTYFMTYVSCRKCNLQPTLLHYKKLARHLIVYPEMLIVLALESIGFNNIYIFTIIDRYNSSI